MSGDYQIRTATREELDTLVEWAAAEGWNPGDHDADAFYAADPAGYYVGVLDGEVIASISAVHYGSQFAFVGYYIVKPEHRGKKYGLQIWMYAMDSLRAGTTGLDGVLAETANYARSGFENAYHNQRYRGAARPNETPDPRIVPFDPSQADELAAYDRTAFPAERRVFLDRWLQQPGASVLVLRDGGRFAGYGMIRPGHDGYRIGPLFADGAEEANALFDALSGAVPTGSPVFIDIPEPNAAAQALVDARNMTAMFETARMYRGPAPDIDIARVFGVTSLELG